MRNGDPKPASDMYGSPVAIVETARRWMGTIDLDPCSHPAAQEIVRATTVYFKEDDGLSKIWPPGNIYENPPYSDILPWVVKTVGQVENGDAPRAVLLLPDAHDTRWYQRAYEAASAVCYLSPRLHFLDSQGQVLKGTVRRGNTIFGFGNPEGFRECFEEFGRVEILREPTTPARDAKAEAEEVKDDDDRILAHMIQVIDGAAPMIDALIDGGLLEDGPDDLERAHSWQEMTPEQKALVMNYRAVDFFVPNVPEPWVEWFLSSYLDFGDAGIDYGLNA